MLRRQIRHTPGIGSGIVCVGDGAGKAIPGISGAGSGPIGEITGITAGVVGGEGDGNGVQHMFATFDDTTPQVNGRDARGSHEGFW